MPFLNNPKLDLEFAEVELSDTKKMDQALRYYRVFGGPWSSLCLEATVGQKDAARRLIWC